MHRAATVIWGTILAVGLLGSPALAQEIPAPAHEAEERAGEAGEEEAGERPDDSEWPVHVWEMPAVEVEGIAPELAEEERIGDYRQPRWTARRRFPTTRVYVVPKGKIELEWWFTVAESFEGGEPSYENQLELEMGLGHRVQLDLYLVWAQDGNVTPGDGDGSMQLVEEKIELRYALADWGEIWGNPTLYFEWIHGDQAADKLEFKTLFGWELAPRWHAGANLVYERELAGEQEQEYKITGGISYTVRDSYLSVGVETELELADEHGDRGDYSEGYLVGPSISFQPVPPAHILITPLIGGEIDKDDPSTEIFHETTVVVGWAF